jgi:hypothetical protein
MVVHVAQINDCLAVICWSLTAQTVLHIKHTNMCCLASQYGLMAATAAALGVVLGVNCKLHTIRLRSYCCQCC